jgi:hypothetical protein
VDRDVGMMLLALGQLADAIDEGQSRAEICEAPRLLDRASGAAPA